MTKVVVTIAGEVVGTVEVDGDGEANQSAAVAWLALSEDATFSVGDENFSAQDCNEFFA